MTTQFPSLDSIQQAESQDNLNRRPDWAKQQYNIEQVVGKVTEITSSTRLTANGNEIQAFEVHIPQPRNLMTADGPEPGVAVINVTAPNLHGKLGSRQEYFYLCESAGIDSIDQLIGREWSFTLAERKPWPTAERNTFYYIATPAGTTNGSKPIMTTEDFNYLNDLLVGRTKEEFEQTALRDLIVRDNPGIQSAILDGSFLRNTVLQPDEHGIYSAVS